ALANGTQLIGQSLALANDSLAASCASGGTTLDVFYGIYVDSLSVVDLVVNGTTTLDTAISLWNGCGESAAEIACSTASTPGEIARFVDVEPGNYLVLVDGPADGSYGSFAISYAAQTVPVNNSCRFPTVIESSTVANGTLVSATNEYSGSCGGSSGAEVVYELDLAADARVRATVTRTSGSFDPILYVRTVCGQSSSEPAATCINRSTDTTEVLDIDTLAAGQYYLLVDSAGGVAGEFALSVDVLPIPPANDRCAGTIPLTDGESVAGTTVGSRNDTTGDCSAGGDEVFYSFSLLDEPRRVVLELGSATGEHALFLQAECGVAASQVACAATTGLDETIELLDLQAGDYTVVVESEEVGGGAFDLRFETLQAVPNDSCDSPLVLENGTPLVDHTSDGAGDNETSSCAPGGLDTVYRYVLASASTVDLTVGADYDTAIALRSPSCTGESSELYCINSVPGAGSESLQIRRQEAGTYYVVLEGIGGATGQATIALEATAPPPAGDYCPEVESIGAGTLLNQQLASPYRDDTLGSCGGAGGIDRVYSFATSGPQHVTITTQSAIAHYLYLRSAGCTTEGGTEAGCGASASVSESQQAMLDFATLPAGTYYVFVDAAGAASGAFSITLSTAPTGGAPPNDQCGGATVLWDDAPLPLLSPLSGAIDDTALACATPPGSYPEVFFTFVLPPADGARRVIASVSSVGNTALALRGSDCVTPIACADATSGGEQVDIGRLEPGDYYLVVEGVGAFSGDFTVRYRTLAPRPANDGCATPSTLTSGTPLVNESIGNATDDPATSSCGGTGGGDVVYSFSIPAPTNKRAKVTVSNAVGFDPLLRLQSATCGGTEVTCVQARTDGTEVLDATNLTPGTYYLWVDSAAATAGSTFDISLELLTAVPPPANDLCSGATLLSNGSTVTASTVGATDNYDLSCLASDSRDAVYKIALGSNQAVLVTAQALSPPWTLGVALRSFASCAGGADISCVSQAYSTRYINRPSLAAGDYAVLVDGFAGQTGDYSIKYETRAADTSFGYWRIDTTSTYVALDGTSTRIDAPNNQLGDSWSVDLPFSFDFFGSTKTATTKVNVSENMYLTFAAIPAGTDAYDNDCPMNSTAPNDLIALFWDWGFISPGAASGFPEPAGEVRTQTQGEAPNRRFAVEFKNFDLIYTNRGTPYLQGFRVSQQVILHENGDVELRYGPRTNTGALDQDCGTDRHLGCSASVGLESSTGGDIDQAQCGTATSADPPDLSDGKVIYWVHPR
ncbi:MAG: hypothetical protein V2A73_11610, partial [Pseudomonadota bacterium]